MGDPVKSSTSSSFSSLFMIHPLVPRLYIHQISGINGVIFRNQWPI